MTNFIAIGNNRKKLAQAEKDGSPLSVVTMVFF
jgi:hypothetical protein